MTTSAQTIKIAQIIEISGLGGMATGIVLSVHHVVIGAFFAAGAIAFAVGYKLRNS